MSATRYPRGDRIYGYYFHVNYDWCGRHLALGRSVMLNYLGPMSTTAHQTDHRAALAEFLRARREALSPVAGRPPGGRTRRTPGLRREEVAMLAGVSVTWYTWLEQGRRINASTDVLRAIGRALRLDDAGVDHLVALGQPDGAPAAVPGYGPDEVPSALRRLIDAFEPAPAYVLGPHWEFAAWNAAQARLYPRIETLDGDERNLIWVLFADPVDARADRRLGHPCPPGARRVPRLDDGVRDDPAMVALVDRLRAASEEFDGWWAEHDVARFETRLRRFNHPAPGC